MAPDRTLSNHRITRSDTAHRLLRSELNDYNFKFKVSLLTLPLQTRNTTRTPSRARPLAPLGARKDRLVLWKYGGEAARK